MPVIEHGFESELPEEVPRVLRLIDDTCGPLGAV